MPPPAPTSSTRAATSSAVAPRPSSSASVARPSSVPVASSSSPLALSPAASSTPVATPSSTLVPPVASHTLAASDPLPTAVTGHTEPVPSTRTPIDVIAICASLGSIVLIFIAYKIYKWFRRRSVPAVPLPPARPFNQHNTGSQHDYYADSISQPPSLVPMGSLSRLVPGGHEEHYRQSSYLSSSSSNPSLVNTPVVADSSVPIAPSPLSGMTTGTSSNEDGEAFDPATLPTRPSRLSMVSSAHHSTYIPSPSGDDSLTLPTRPSRLSVASSVRHSTFIPSPYGPSDPYDSPALPSRPSRLSVASSAHHAPYAPSPYGTQPRTGRAPRPRPTSYAASISSRHSMSTVRGPPHAPHNRIEIVLPAPLAPELFPYIEYDNNNVSSHRGREERRSRVRSKSREDLIAAFGSSGHESETSGDRSAPASPHHSGLPLPNEDAEKPIPPLPPLPPSLIQSPTPEPSSSQSPSSRRPRPSRTSAE